MRENKKWWCSLKKKREVKNQVAKLIVREKEIEMVFTQVLLKNLLMNPHYPGGLYLSLTSPRREKRDNEGCRCEKGFELVRVTLDLSEWKD